VEGTPDEQGIHQVIRPLYMKFKDAIKGDRSRLPAIQIRGVDALRAANLPCDRENGVGFGWSAIYVDQVMNMALQ
jgi:hypothetical protein